MHLSNGEIKTYQDQELSEDTRQRVQAHLESCPHCRSQSEALRASSQRVQVSLSALDPESSQRNLSAGAARARLSAATQDKEVKTMWNKIFSKQARPVWIALIVIVVLAISLTLAPVRAIANSFLGLFRVEQFAVVQVNPADLPEQLGSSTQLEYMLTQNVDIEGRGEPFSVPNKEQASASAGFDVRLPTGLSKPLHSLEVQPGGKVTFVVNAAQIQALLDEIDRSDIQIPTGVNGATVTLQIPDGVTAMYGDCEFDPGALVEAGYDPDSSETPRLPNCTTLVQVPSPTISAPPGLDLTKIGEAYLQLLGMTREEAESFAQKVDWTTTFVFPLPMYATAFNEIPVDGVTGILITQELDDHASQYMLMWVKDGIAYVLTGPGNSSTAANIARSLR